MGNKCQTLPRCALFVDEAPGPSDSAPRATPEPKQLTQPTPPRERHRVTVRPRPLSVCGVSRLVIPPRARLPSAVQHQMSAGRDAAMAEYTPLDRLNAEAQPQAEPQQPPAAMQHVIADEDRVTRKHEKMRMRLEAEASLGVQAALIGSFALTMLPEAKEMEHARQWLFVCSMAAAGVLCLLCVITSGTIYWAGLHLLSATKNTTQEEVDMFRLFWKASVSKHGGPTAIPTLLAGDQGHTAGCHGALPYALLLASKRS